MNDLSTLLRDAADHAPHDPFDAQLVLRQGRSRVRRRRVGTGLAAACALGLVAGIPLALDQVTSQREPGPAGGTVVEVTLGDASRAREGTDYAVVRSFEAHFSDRSQRGSLVQGLLPDGSILTRSYPQGIDGPTRLELVGEGSDRGVTVPADLANFLGSTPRSLVFGSNTSGLWLVDRTTLETTHVLREHDFDVNGDAQVIESADETIELAAGMVHLETRRALFSVDLATETVRELATGGDVTSDEQAIAWTDRFDDYNTRVTLRDPDGRTTSFDPHTGDCVQKDLALTPDRVVVMTNCADRPRDDSMTDVVDRIDVFTRDGDPVVRLTGSDFGPVRATDGHLTLSSWKEGETGVYVYDLATGRLLKAVDGATGLTSAATGAGDVVLWQEPGRTDADATYVLARMLP